MTDKTIKLDIVSAEEELFSAQVQMVFAPALMGEVGISPKHTPLMTKLKAGDVRAQISETETKTFFISSSNIAILVKPYVWTETTYLKKNTVVTVYSSHSYNEKSYIRSLDSFKKIFN